MLCPRSLNKKKIYKMYVTLYNYLFLFTNIKRLKILIAL